MIVLDMKVGDLIPYENNPRKNDEAVQYVANSIKEFGFKVPIIVDAENIIVAGHTRWKAAQMLGLETVPVIRADDLTPAQIKAYRLADNKTGEMASWDYSKLDLEMSDLDFDMKDFGFLDASLEWEDVPELSEESYEEPEHTMLECPSCHHIDRDIHFKKV